MSFADRKKEFSKSIQVDDSFTFGLAASLLSALTFPPRADLMKSVTKGYIHKVCSGAPTISHLFFDDDNIFFFRASEEESCKIKSILGQYCKASGQVINYEKLEISFSENVEQHVITCEASVALDHSPTTLADNGRSVNVWEDFWLADHKRLGPKPYNNEVNYVRDLLNNDGDDWNYYQLISLFPSNIANKIAFSFVSQSRPDSLYWYNSPRGEFSCKLAYLLALETSQELVQNDSDEAIKIFHAIWMAKYFHGQSYRREAAVEVMAKQLLLDYLSANKKDLARRMETPQTNLRDLWTKLQVTQIKFNCDATWKKESGNLGMGFVARNCNGEVLLSGARSEFYVNSPLEAEAKAVW
nr:reverse transcriptase [Tanacetum cinerariifolium]